MWQRIKLLLLAIYILFLWVISEIKTLHNRHKKWIASFGDYLFLVANIVICTILWVGAYILHLLGWH